MGFPLLFRIITASEVFVVHGISYRIPFRLRYIFSLLLRLTLFVLHFFDPF